MLNRKLSHALNTTNSKLDQLKRLNIKTVRDLIMHFPRTYSDDREFTLISNLKKDEKQVVKGIISQLFSRKTKTRATSKCGWQENW